DGIRAFHVTGVQTCALPISDHMVRSKATSPHVTSFTECDVTNIVNWRNKIKGSFEKKYGEKITFTPIFIEAIVNCIRKYPMINRDRKERRVGKECRSKWYTA